MKLSIAALGFTLTGIASAFEIESVPYRIDFEGYEAGDWASDVGFGVTVKAGPAPGNEEGCFGPMGNQAMIFNSSNPTGGDTDLGSPHGRCEVSGPGVGRGGRPGETTENCVPLGNLLIISEDCNQEDPDDGIDGGTFTFDFEVEMGVKSIGLLDFKSGTFVYALDKNGGPLYQGEFPGVRNNGFLEMVLDVKQGVKKLIITTQDSGGLAYIQLYGPIDPVGCYGDPHCKKWNGDIFEFPGACDLIMLDNLDFPYGEMEIQMRTMTQDDFSFIQSVALKIGTEILEVLAGNYGGGAAASPPAFFAGFAVSYREATVPEGTLKVLSIELGHNDAIVIKSFPHLVDLRIRSNENRMTLFGGSKGLLGDLSGAMLSPDGDEIMDPVSFALSWQVPMGESLFAAPVVNPVCVFPGEEMELRARRQLKESPDATTACQKFASSGEMESCVSAVLATGDAKIAEHYL